MSASVIVAAVSVVIAAMGLLFTMRQANLLRRKEYADRIRGAASETSAALDRWKRLCLRLYEEIQPLLTEADMEIVETGDTTRTRDHLWRGLVQARAKVTERISAEKIETAYVNLYGYDAQIQPLFMAVTELIQAADEAAYEQLLEETQNNIFQIKPDQEPFESTMLGNLLRKTCVEQASSLSRALNVITEPCATWLLSIIQATDSDIVKKHITSPEIIAQTETRSSFAIRKPQADKGWRTDAPCLGPRRLVGTTVSRAELSRRLSPLQQPTRGQPPKNH